ncbi:haloalkane dehalogenase [Xanthovirga aplysinae]|uniref:haloalkane dehalogenase n=1 Tax=Xanthovirga aplysinae TaxID=2529853 RepID=UPI0012BD13C0|nr:haloalkane dehalogenase [Xanthovirga aplysinae]MTI32138.1 haloalkane dehalogenase [Xanthovirga aplysinae]
MNSVISPDFPFESKFLEVNGSRMHYVDVGEGDPILFLHGQPTSSYLWRNVIPHLQSMGRCIAPDLIGMGKSDKPDLSYSFHDHYDYLEKFIKKLNLKNITLVIHDWGSGLGFNYANNHRDNIKGIAFMEAMIQPLSWDDFHSDFKLAFKMMRTPFVGWLMLSVGNMFLNKVVPDLIVRKLSKEELANYKRPYPTVASRKPVRTWPTQIPIDGKPMGVFNLMTAYNKWLTETDIPKLCLYAQPGAILKKKEVEYIRNSFPNTKMVDIGKGLHFIQEDNPHFIGQEIAKWVDEI